MPMGKLFWISNIPAIIDAKMSSPWEGGIYNIS